MIFLLISQRFLYEFPSQPIQLKSVTYLSMNYSTLVEKKDLVHSKQPEGYKLNYLYVFYKTFFFILTLLPLKNKISSSNYVCFIANFLELEILYKTFYVKYLNH